MFDSARIYQLLPIDKVICGRGAVSQIPVQVDQMGRRKAFIITGNTMATKTNLVDELVSHLKTKCAGVFHECKQHIPRSTVFKAAQQARKSGADMVISFGGGTPIDTAKAVSFVLSQNIEEESQMMKFKVQYEYGKRMEAPPIQTERIVPHIAIPTTMSGGEFTSGFGPTNEATGAKEIINYPSFVPRIIVLDPEVTLMTPEELWLSTGIKSVDHTVEAFFSLHHHPLTDTLSKSALSQLLQYLPLCKLYPEDLRIRQNLQVAAWFAILHVAPSVRWGLSHAVGHQVGGMFNIPHGITSCIFLPPTLEFNRPVNAERQALLAETVGIRTAYISADQAAMALQQIISDLIVQLGLPHKLRQFDVPQTKFDAIAQHVLSDLTLETNPRRITGTEDIVSILKSAW